MEFKMMKLLIAILLLLGCSRSEFFNHKAETQSASQDATMDPTQASTNEEEYMSPIGKSPIGKEEAPPPIGTTQSSGGEEAPPPYSADGYEYYRFKLGKVTEEITDDPKNDKYVWEPQEAYFDIRIQGNVADRKCNLVGEQNACIIEKEVKACFIDKTRSVTHNFANDDTYVIYWPPSTVILPSGNTTNRYGYSYRTWPQPHFDPSRGFPSQRTWYFSAEWWSLYGFYGVHVYALVPDLKEGGNNYAQYTYYHMDDRSLNKQVPYTPEDSCFLQ